MEKKSNVYLALGESASMYVDSTNRYVIRNGEVIVVSTAAFNESSSLKHAIKGGHIVKADKDDYEAYIAKKNQPAPPKDVTKGKVETKTTVEQEEPVEEKAEGKTVEELEELTKSELMDLMEPDEKIGMTRKELKKLAPEELIELYHKYYK